MLKSQLPDSYGTQRQSMYKSLLYSDFKEIATIMGAIAEYL
jgi:hypothetical protein